jgi:hypothetical protein
MRMVMVAGKISGAHVMSNFKCKLLYEERIDKHICMVTLAHKITCIKLVILLIGPNLIVLTLTNGKVLEWFKSLERGNSLSN